MENWEDSYAIRQLDTAGPGVDFCYKVRSHPLIVAFFHGSAGFHISDVNKNLIAYGVYGGVFSVYVRVLFIMLLGLLGESFELGNDPVEPVGNSIGSVELSFLGDC